MYIIYIYMCVYITMREFYTQFMNGMQKYRGKNLNKTMINTKSNKY